MATLASLAWTHVASAEEALRNDRDPGQSPEYWAVHGTATAALFVTSALIPAGQGKYLKGYSLADGLSEALFALELVLPVPSLATVTDGAEFANATLIYAETFAASAVVRSISDALCLEMGRAPTAFAIGALSSYLFAEEKPGQKLTASYWGVQMFLATTSAHLQVRARTGSVGAYLGASAGALIGSSLGFAAFALHGGDVGPGPKGDRVLGLTKADWRGIAVGGGLGAILPILFVPREYPESASYPVAVVPIPVESGAGVGVQGLW